MFKCDWSRMYTAEQAEEELREFKFEGPGWYLGKNNDVLLVIPCDREIKDWWHKKWEERERFYFMVYNNRNPADAFNAIVNAPTRRDDREEEKAVDEREEQIRSILEKYITVSKDLDLVLALVLKHGVKSPKVLRQIGTLQKENRARGGSYKALVKWEKE
jgi:hypothetical protein